MRRHDASADDGFTLVELMVVILVIAILLAIAIPTFLAARNRASDRLAQTSLRTALNNARVAYSDGQSFLRADATGLVNEDNSLRFVPGGTRSTYGTEVSVDASAGTTWFAAVRSKSGQCYFLQDSGGSAPTSYLRSDSLDCNAATGAANASSFTTALP
jgi:type IV pilus assembly protein PilA